MSIKLSNTPKMVLKCFSYYGVEPLVPIKVMMNSEKYTDVLTKKVTSQMARTFPEGSGVFQQNLAPCRTSCTDKNVFALNSLSVLNWPENSPNLIPRENLRSIKKLQLRRKDCIIMVKI